MKSPLGRVSPRVKATAFAIGVIATLVYAFFLQRISQGLETVQAPLGIVSFEVAGTPENTLSIVNSWDDDAKQKARLSLQADFGFLGLYTVTLALVCYLGSEAARWRGWRGRAMIALLLALGQIVAGALDLMENRYLLEILDVHPGDYGSRPFWAAVCAYAKFGLLLAGGLCGLAAISCHEELMRIFNRTLRPWFEWCTRYPLLAFVAIAIVLFVQDPELGRSGLGLHYLFWHDDPRVQVMAGIGLAGLISELCFVGYLLDADEAWMCHSRRRRRQKRLIWYLAVTAIPMLVCIVYPAFSDIGKRFPLVLSLFVAALFSGAVSWWLSKFINASRAERLCGWLARYFGWLFVLFPIPREPLLARLHVIATVYFTLIFTLYAGFVAVPFQWFLDAPGLLSPALAICALLGLIVAVYGRIVFSVPFRSFGVFAALVVLGIGVAGLTTYPHRFDGLRYYYKGNNPIALTDVDLRDQPSNARSNSAATENLAWLQAWHAQHAPATKPKLVVITISGGGLRSAVWATVVLSELEKAIPDFPKHIRLITGTSGGMLGAAYYVTTIPPPGQSRQVALDVIVENIGRDSLSAPVRTWLVRDMPFAGQSGFDRGQALEEAWEQNTLEPGDDAPTVAQLSSELTSLAKHEKAGWLPSLVFAPMLVEDGRRLLISNLDLHHLLKTRGSRLGSEDRLYSISAVQLMDLFPEAAIKLSTAVRMNASFPYITPVGLLPTDPPRRVVDAGYYDNYGINMAAAWLNDLWSNQRSWLEQNVSGVVLVQIIDHPIKHNRTTLLQAGERFQSLSQRGLQWLSTPGHAVLSAREATMSFRNDEQVQQLSQSMNQSGPSEFFTSVTFEFTGDASLSWYLSRKERDQLKGGMAEPEKKQSVESLKQHLAKQD